MRVRTILRTYNAVPFCQVVVLNNNRRVVLRNMSR